MAGGGRGLEGTSRAMVVGEGENEKERGRAWARRACGLSLARQPLADDGRRARQEEMAGSVQDGCASKLGPRLDVRPGAFCRQRFSTFLYRPRRSHVDPRAPAPFAPRAGLHASWLSRPRPSPAHLPTALSVPRFLYCRFPLDRAAPCRSQRAGSATRSPRAPEPKSCCTQTSTPASLPNTISASQWTFFLVITGTCLCVSQYNFTPIDPLSVISSVNPAAGQRGCLGCRDQFVAVSLQAQVQIPHSGGWCGGLCRVRSRSCFLFPRP